MTHSASYSMGSCPLALEIKFKIILTKKISELVHFGLFGSNPFLQMAHIVMQVGAVFFATSVGIEKPVQTCTIYRGALKFATQFSHLLNYLNYFVWSVTKISVSIFRNFH